MYILGDTIVEDIFYSFQLTDTEAQKFKIVCDKYDNHFISKRNVVYDHTIFNRWVQNENEDVTSFNTDLFTLSKFWEYVNLL